MRGREISHCFVAAVVVSLKTKQVLLKTSPHHESSVWCDTKTEDIYNRDANGLFKLYPQLEFFPKKYEAIKRCFHSGLSTQQPSKESLDDATGRRAHSVSLDYWNFPKFFCSWSIWGNVVFCCLFPPPFGLHQSLLTSSRLTFQAWPSLLRGLSCFSRD